MTVSKKAAVLSKKLTGGCLSSDDPVAQHSFAIDPAPPASTQPAPRAESPPPPAAAAVRTISRAPSWKSCLRRSLSIPTPCWLKSCRSAIVADRAGATLAHEEPGRRAKTIFPARAQSWDPSVKALRAFRPSSRSSTTILTGRRTWRRIVNQPQDVADVIQLLRLKAEKAGALKTTRSKKSRGKSRTTAKSWSSRPPTRRWSMFLPTIRLGV